MGRLDERKERRMSLAPMDSDIESVTSSLRNPTLLRSIVENTKYVLVYAGLLLLLAAILAAVGVSIWLGVKGYREKAAERAAMQELKDAVVEEMEVVGGVVEGVASRFRA